MQNPQPLIGFPLMSVSLTSTKWIPTEGNVRQLRITKLLGLLTDVGSQWTVRIVKFLGCIIIIQAVPQSPQPSEEAEPMDMGV